MKNRRLSIFFLILSTLSYAQSGGNFSMKKSVIASGGGKSNGGNFRVNGTMGQTAVSPETTGGNFILTGGFWQIANKSDTIFMNGFEN